MGLQLVAISSVAEDGDPEPNDILCAWSQLETWAPIYVLPNGSFSCATGGDQVCQAGINEFCGEGGSNPIEN